jgi:hypothetical protein
MCVYGFKVRSDVSVDDAIMEVSKYLVTGVFLNPVQSTHRKEEEVPEGVLDNILGEGMVSRSISPQFARDCRSSSPRPRPGALHF